MGGEWVECYVGDDVQFWKVFVQGVGGVLGDVFWVVCFGGVQGFFFYWGYWEQCQCWNVQGYLFFCFDQ